MEYCQLLNYRPGWDHIIQVHQYVFFSFLFWMLLLKSMYTLRYLRGGIDVLMARRDTVYQLIINCKTTAFL
jgi:hypothetical protein